MRSLMLAACAAAVLLVPVRAAQNAAHADSPRVTISVDHPTQVGDTVSSSRATTAFSAAISATRPFSS